MVDTPAKVSSCMTDMAAAARPAAMRDYDKNLQVLRELRPGADQIEFWQTAWLSPKVQQKFYAYNPQDARQYFAYDNVRDGILQLTEDLFGVQIRPWNTPKWDPEVETYEMVENGKVIGRFYFDSHPRPGQVHPRQHDPAARQASRGEPPVAALVMNLPDGDHSTGLMEHSQVTTFLHEFGHMLHGMFGGTKAGSASRAWPPSGTSSRRRARCSRTGSTTTTRWPSSRSTRTGRRSRATSSSG